MTLEEYFGVSRRLIAMTDTAQENTSASQKGTTIAQILASEEDVQVKVPGRARVDKVVVMSVRPEYMA